MAKGISRTLLFVDIESSWINNYNSGSETWVSDSVVNTAISVAIFAVTAVPVIGWTLSIGLGIGVSVLESNTDLIDNIKDWTSGIGREIEKGWSNLWNFSWV